MSNDTVAPTSSPARQGTPVQGNSRGVVQKAISWLLDSDNSQSREAAEAAASLEREAALRAKQHAEHVAGQTRFQYFQALNQAIFAEAQGNKIHATISQGGGGAGKTTVGCYVMDTLANATRRPNMIIDTNDNMGDAYEHLGVSIHKTKTVKGVAKLLESVADGSEIYNPIQFVNQLASTKGGTMLIAADLDLGPEEMYPPELLEAVITYVQEQIAPIVMVDTGNTVRSPGNKTLLELTAAQLIPSTVRPQVLSRAAATRRNNIAQGFPQLTRNAIFVVTGVEFAHLGTDFRAKINYTEGAETVVLPEEQNLFIIPFDQRIKDGEQVDVTCLALDTQIAFAELALATIRTSVHFQAHKAEADVRPLVLEQGRMVELPSGRLPILSYIQDYEARPSGLVM